MQGLITTPLNTDIRQISRNPFLLSLHATSKLATSHSPPHEASKAQYSKSLCEFKTLTLFSLLRTPKIYPLISFFAKRPDCYHLFFPDQNTTSLNFSMWTRCYLNRVSSVLRSLHGDRSTALWSQPKSSFNSSFTDHSSCPQNINNLLLHQVFHSTKKWEMNQIVNHMSVKRRYSVYEERFVNVQLHLDKESVTAHKTFLPHKWSNSRCLDFNVPSELYCILGLGWYLRGHFQFLDVGW